MSDDLQIIHDSIIDLIIAVQDLKAVNQYILLCIALVGGIVLGAFFWNMLK